MDGLFGNIFDINGDGELSAGERMMDFALFHHMATEGDEAAEKLSEAGIDPPSTSSSWTMTNAAMRSRTRGWTPTIWTSKRCHPKKRNDSRDAIIFVRLAPGRQQ